MIYFCSIKPGSCQKNAMFISLTNSDIPVFGDGTKKALLFS